MPEMKKEDNRSQVQRILFWLYKLHSWHFFLWLFGSHHLQAYVCNLLIFRVLPFLPYPCLFSLVHIVLPLNFLLIRLSEAIPSHLLYSAPKLCFFHTTHLTLGYKGRKVSSAENMHRRRFHVFCRIEIES